MLLMLEVNSAEFTRYVTPKDVESSGRSPTKYGAKLKALIKPNPSYMTEEAHRNIRTTSVFDTETKTHYWLTVVAQDYGVVPLYSTLEVYVEIKNVNDNAPLTKEPVYYPHIMENSPPGTPVIQITATDPDSPTILYRITSGNPESFFSIDTRTGVISTTGRKLDREYQAEHVLEITLTDDGTPPLHSSTRVVITIDDENDNSPHFQYKFYNIHIPETRHHEAPLIQIIAIDNDLGNNSSIFYEVMSGRGKNKFKIHPTAGAIYSLSSFQHGEEYDLLVRATDQGKPNKSAIAKISVRVLPLPDDSKHPPDCKTKDQHVSVQESDSVGFLVILIQCDDLDGDVLWYNIIDGDPRSEFMIVGDEGSILLAKRLDWEVQSKYNLTIKVTDGIYNAYTQVFVSVVDINEYRPIFSKPIYTANISESSVPGTEVVKLTATDADRDSKVVYSLYNAQSPSSLHLFKVDYQTGSLSVAKPLDRETIAEHIITVMVKDQATPAKRNFARVIIKVNDANDHAPEFSVSIMQGRVFETSPIGTTVLSLNAVDKDHGINAKVVYSLQSGNVGNAFFLDPVIGSINVARDLDISIMNEYMLIIKASDSGNPPLASTIPVHIIVVMADNAPPRFTRREVAAELYENEPARIVVKHLEARSTSSLHYEIVQGNVDNAFYVNPTTGAGAKAVCHVVVHLMDRNDNPPYFRETLYQGWINEGAPIASLVFYNQSSHLVLAASDEDSQLNALLQYDIVEPGPQRWFHIDSTTGAIRTIATLDHETDPLIEFHVKVTDLGKPRLSSETLAKVVIKVNDINDCSPKFSQRIYNTSILTPTYANIAVLQLNATDKDSANITKLSFSIRSGNVDNVYSIGSETGIITVHDPISGAKTAPHRLRVAVTDGKFVDEAMVYITWEHSQDSGLKFQRSIYHGSVLENSTKSITVAVVTVLGSHLNEHLTFSILNPSPYFTIGPTSGALRTTGVRFDREHQERYQLIVQTRSKESREDEIRVAHVAVNVTVLDINDNCPMFVNLPYYAVVSVDAKKGDVITKVHAIDLDKGENGEVRYELIRGSGDLFKVCRKTGEVTPKQALEGHNREYQLIIAAYDGGSTPCSTKVNVVVKVMDRSMPIFDKQFYTVSTLENIDLHSPLSISIQAESPLGRKLIYSIVSGNNDEKFAVDFNTGGLYVVDELDYETQQEYALYIRATDSVSGVSADVPVNVLVLDVNDSPPEFMDDAYNVSVSEAAPFGTIILKLTAHDNDTGLNAKIRYSLKNDNNTTENFHIDPEDGSIYLKRSLDHETQTLHHIVAIATDCGIPNLSSSVHVWIKVLDMNDNPPKLEKNIYAWLSEEASRGQVVTIVTASDRDSVDHKRLVYSIVGGNQQQTFFMDPTTGTPVVKVTATDKDSDPYGYVSYFISSDKILESFEIYNLTGEIMTKVSLDREKQKVYEIPVVAIDTGGKVGFSIVRVWISDANDNSPVFVLPEYKACIHSNFSINSVFLKVKAVDKDEDHSAQIEYSIYEKEASGVRDLFQINKNTGGLSLLRSALPSENQMFQFFIRATDKGFPPLHSDVPVDIYIMSQKDVSPMFERRDDKFFVTESAAPGTVITRVKLITEMPVNYRLLSGKDYFIIDPSGVISLSGRLDRELFPSHVIGVLAYTESSPPLTAVTEISLQVLDSNDNKPIFDSAEYKIKIAENIKEGSPILKVHASDADEGTNGEIQYSLTGPGTAIFSIDSHTGWIISLVALDREITEHYTLTVIASDSGAPTHTSNATVFITLIDYNDNPPKFVKNSYSASVSENAMAGTVVVQVSITDRDSESSNIVFYIIGGDPHSQFDVKLSGEVYVTRPLDREAIDKYKLSIFATDGKHSTVTTLYVDVLDENDQEPYCLLYRYKETISEAVPPGYYILTVKAVDLDLGSKLKFYLTGDNAEYFNLDRTTGELKTLKSLDRERISEFHLTAHVQDREHIEWECISHIDITVLDVNDNAPVFSSSNLSVSVSEGASIGSLVTKIHAIDDDIGVNRKIRYVLVDSADGHFKIVSDSGIITLARVLDRETKDSYNLTVKAVDQGLPQLWNVASLTVHVLDVNDNPPEFQTRTHHASIPENAAIDTHVTQVMATSIDAGINAQIEYSIVGGNEHGKFAIEYDTGIITIAQPLDYERAREYLITVQATDLGVPPLSNQATVNITVLDSNDNAPVFSEVSYSAKIAEDAMIGEIVAQVSATDLDTEENGDVTYSIERGDAHQQFSIHPKTGEVSVIQPLDRELVSSYVLQIRASDNGESVLSSSAILKIEVLDVNDNPPLFTQTNYTVIVQEDKRPGWIVCQLLVTDSDISPNAGPFIFDILAKKGVSAFRIEKDGTIRTAALLSHKLESTYTLHVRVFDNGNPPLYSDTWVIVKVIEESQYPPIATPLDIWIGSYQERWDGGEIGRVHATDQDQFDILNFSLVPSHQVPGISPYNFITTQRKRLLKELRLVLKKEVSLISVQDSGSGDTDVLLFIKGGVDIQSLNSALLTMNLPLLQLECNCLNGALCRQRIALNPERVITISSDLISFVSPSHSHDVYCACNLGYSGERCDELIPPAQCECPPSQTCIAQPAPPGFVCAPPSPASPLCSPNHTCPPPQTPSFKSAFSIITWQQLMIAGIIIIIILVLCLTCLICKCCCRNSRQNDLDKTSSVLNSDVKRTSKLSNLEVTQCIPRPASYTSGSHNDVYAGPLNNLDTVRSYGSAGDELESVPPDYVKNLNRNANSPGHKINNGYHWDCSDWVRPNQNPLPNITEVPGSEVPDSSSFHSNDSNDSNTVQQGQHHAQSTIIDPARDLATLDEELYMTYRSEEDDVITYGFPQRYPSQSDVSTNLCDIEDSDVPT
ncbi:fat-like cadherin-related tumor suppressor homolog [Cimex lectularius]|uniref:Cadherin domain-containing protein n=1 Tax=Cimex lectularius TaxID=79782 RepID=A0A8I6SRZ1_CIMLE|nr:fat-like cadherin-related tumor suppressor homolog [Cimex lectularius]